MVGFSPTRCMPCPAHGKSQIASGKSGFVNPHSNQSNDSRGSLRSADFSTDHRPARRRVSTIPHNISTIAASSIRMNNPSGRFSIRPCTVSAAAFTNNPNVSGHARFSHLPMRITSKSGGCNRAYSQSSRQGRRSTLPTM